MQGRVRRLVRAARVQSVGVLLMLLGARVRNLALLELVLVRRGVRQGRRCRRRCRWYGRFASEAACPSEGRCSDTFGQVAAIENVEVRGVWGPDGRVAGDSIAADEMREVLRWRGGFAQGSRVSVCVGQGRSCAREGAAE